MAGRSQDLSYSSHNAVAVWLLSLQLRLKKEKKERHLPDCLPEFLRGSEEPGPQKENVDSTLLSEGL